MKDGAKARLLLLRAPPLLLALFLFLAMVVPLLAPGDPYALDVQRKLLPPGQGGLLGTDALGRDVFTRIAHGGRTALIIGLATVSLSMALSSSLGLTAGYAGGRWDAAVSALLDLLLTLPGLLVTLAILGVLGTGRLALVAALVGASWAGEARILRAAALTIRTSGYVDAAHAVGAGELWILWRHVLPNTTSTMLVLASLNLGEALLVVAALSFLGLGTQPPDADWGTMLADGRAFFGQAPWLMMAPGACIVLYSMLCNLTGDALGTLLDRRRGR